MKKPKHDDIDIEQIDIECAAKLLETVASAPLQTQAPQKIRKRKKPSQTQQSSIFDRVEKEIRGYEVEQGVKPFRDYVLEPLPELGWTKNHFADYEDARLSAEIAMRRIFASTDAARVGFETGHPESVLLERFFHKVSTGSIQADSPEILEMLQYAQRVGRTQSYLFIERLVDELKNAKRRVPGAPAFSEYRARLTRLWMRAGFWLMSDNLISRLTHVSRQAVARAVKELNLVKHPDTARAPIVKGVDEKGRFVFRPGYPPTG